jgi:hypothetical protein
MNRKGDAPMLLLVMVTLALMIMMIFIFITFGGDLKSKSLEYSKLSSGLEFNYQYVVSSAKIIVKESVESKAAIAEIAEKYNYNVVGQGNLFGKMRNGEFKFDQNKFVAEGLFVTSENGASSAKRVFDLCLQFDNKGEFLNNC